VPPATLVPFACGQRTVGGDHGTAGGRSQLPRCLARCGAGDDLIHGGGVPIGEPGDLVGDHLGAGQVDVAGSQRGAGCGQPAERDRQV